MHHVVKCAGATALAASALILAACGQGHLRKDLASASANPTVSTAMSEAERNGFLRLEVCLPNGHAIVPAVENGSASLLTAFQVVKAFKGQNLREVEARCLPGGGNHPVESALSKFEGCMKGSLSSSVQTAIKPWASHPITYRHQVAQASALATLKVAAVCLPAPPKAAPSPKPNKHRRHH